MKKLFVFVFLVYHSIFAFPQAIVALEKAAENGDVQAQLFLGKSCLEGSSGLQKNVQKAYYWYLKAAQQGNAEAQYNVALILFSGPNENFKEATIWMQKSADNNYAPALCTMGMLLLNSKYDKPQVIFDYFIRAASQSFPPAFVAVAQCYYEGIGVAQNADDALKYFNMSVNAGNNNALLGIAYCYKNLKKDYNEAFIWYQKAVNVGIPQAYNDIAYMYAEGKGVKKDLQKAFEMVDIAISKDPNQPNFYDSKGEFYLMEGKIDKAREMWNKVLSLDKNAANSNSPLALAMSNNVDNNIPVSAMTEDKTFAVVFANEDYKRVASVPYAKNDGKIFSEYCKKTLGIPERNVYYVENATLGDMKYYMNLLKKIAQAFNGEAKIILYYAGHGIPDEAQKNGYLLPIDGYGNDATSGYSLKNLYSELASIPSKSVLVFMDACFSGSQRDGNMLDAARGVAIKSKAEVPTGNVVVFSAASGDETAYPFKEKNHGLFTYFLLKKMQDSKGDVSLGELGDYIVTNVEQTSITNNKKSQTPTVTPSLSIGNTWRNMKLK